MLFHTPPHINALLTHLSVTFLNEGERSTKAASRACSRLASGKPVFGVSKSGCLCLTSPVCPCAGGQAESPPPRCSLAAVSRALCVPPAPRPVGAGPFPAPTPGGSRVRPCSSSPTVPGSRGPHELRRDSEQAWRGLRWDAAADPAMLPLRPLAPFSKIKPVKAGETCVGEETLPVLRGLCTSVRSRPPAGARVHPRPGLLRCGSVSREKSGAAFPPLRPQFACVEQSCAAQTLFFLFLNH